MLIVTKSDLVGRDMDTFRRTPTVVSITIATPTENIAGLIESHAPPTRMRFSALKRISEENIPTAVRIDPIIPILNSDREDLEKMVSEAAEAGVEQVTASTLKPTRGFIQSSKKPHPGVFHTLKRAYADGEWITGYKYICQKSDHAVYIYQLACRRNSTPFSVFAS